MNAHHDPRGLTGGGCGRCGCNRLPCPVPPQRAGVITGDFCEYTACLKLFGERCFTDAFPTQNARTMTVFAENLGPGPAVVFLQNSPNGIGFVDDPQRLELTAGQMGYLVPYIFSKYTRAAAESGEDAAVRLWFQIQNDRYFLRSL